MNNQNEDRKYAVVIPEGDDPNHLALIIRELDDSELEIPEDEELPAGRFRSPTLRFLQKTVRGCITTISLRIRGPKAGHLVRYSCYGNDESIMIGMLPNLLAANLYGGPIYGPAVILGDDGRGYSPALTIAEVAELRESIMDHLQTLVNRGKGAPTSMTLEIVVPWRDNQETITHKIERRTK